MVKSTEELQKVLKLGNTFYLRKNIEQVPITDDNTGETQNIWRADEIAFEKEGLTTQKVENNFQIYWDWAELKRQEAKEKSEKEALVRKLIDKEYTLADLKETVDQLLVDSLGV